MNNTNKQPTLIKIGENEYQFQDMHDKKSEIFYHAMPYGRGFAMVKRRQNDKDYLYRDMIGNLSQNRSIVGIMFFQFAHGFINFNSIPATCFANDKFFEEIQLVLLDKLAKQIEKRTSEGKHVDIRRIKENKDRIIDQCREKREKGLEILKRRRQIRKKGRMITVEEAKESE